MVVVFDFDGTIADSLSVMLRLYNSQAPKRGLRPITPKDWETIRRMRFTEVLRFAGIKAYQIPKLLNEGKRLLVSRTADIKLFPGIDAVVKNLHQNGHQLFVLSTNAQRVVQAVLQQNDLAAYLKVLRSTKIFGKANTLRRLLRQTKVKKTKMWMVGDEIRDINAARRAGVLSLAVAWGFQPKDVLLANDPTALADKPADILKIINS